MGTAASVPVARYLLGVAALAVVVGSLASAAVALRRRFWPLLDGPVARLAEVVIGFSLLTLILEALGTVGAFRLGWIVGGCVVVGVVAVRGTSLATLEPGGVAEGVPLQRGPAFAVATLATAAVVAEWAAPTVQSYRFGILTLDSLWYHLPWAASFAQTGHITALRFTDVEYLTAFYPATSELFHGLGIVLLGRDTLSPALNLMWLGLVVLAGYCIGRPRGLGALTATGAALAMALPMFSSSQGGSAANDVVGVFFLLAAVALLDTPILAGAAAGLAVAMKLTLLAPIAALVMFAPGARRRLVSAAVITGGYWYVRNLIAVGNPLPWVGPLARPAPALQQHTAFAVWHYLLHPHLLERGLRSGLGPWWQLVVAVVVLGPVVCLAPPADSRTRRLGLVALAAVLAYLLTPETAAGPRGDPVGFTFNLRYAAPAIALSLTVLPLAGVLDRRRTAVLVGLAALIVATLTQTRLWPSHGLLGAVAVGAAALVTVRRPRALMLAIPVLAIGGYPLQQHYLRARYAFHPGISSLAHVWARFRGIHHARVGIVGTFVGFFSYPLYGVDDSNRVQYIARRGPHGSFTPIGSCREWRLAVDRGRYQWLVTTPARDPWHPHRLGPSPEAGWTAPATVVYRQLADGQPITIFRLDGPLDPAGCPRRVA